MTGNEYQRNAMRTNDGRATNRLCDEIFYPTHGNEIGGIINACLGLSGEVGELNDMIKKWIFHEKDLDEVHLKKELGDVMWYVAMMCHSMNWDLDDVMELNVDKLKSRYPDGFDVDRANHRSAEDV